MDSQITAAIVTVGLTITGGIFGYFYREYLNRVQPFMSTTSVRGDFKNTGSIVQIPKEIINSIKSSFFINKIDEGDNLSEIERSWVKVIEILQFGPELIRMANKIIEAIDADDRNEVLNLLPKVLSSETNHKWILILLTLDKIKPISVDEKLPIIVPTYDSNDRDGCVWLSFPQQPVTFGRGFKKIVIIKDKCDPFIDLIERLDMKNLKEIFQDIKKIIESEITIAKDINPLFKDLFNENSNWAVEIYLANIGPYPFLIGKQGILHVEDETGAKYDEPCHLVLIKKDKDANIYRQKAEAPLVVGKEKDIKVAFFTNLVQGKMKRGKAFREAFTSKSAYCWMTLEVEKVGFKRHKELKTPKLPFNHSD